MTNYVSGITSNVIAGFRVITSSKFKLVGFLSLWIGILTIWLITYGNTFSSSGYYDDNKIYHSRIKPSDKGNIEVVDVFQHQGIQKVTDVLGYHDRRAKDVHSHIYDQILHNHEFESLLKLSFKERCDLYFKNLYVHDKNWYIDPNADLSMEHRLEFNFEDFRKHAIKDLKNDFAKEHDNIKVENVKDEDVLTQESEDKIKTDYEEFRARNLQKETTMVNYLSHLRIFNKCYITSDSVEQINDVKNSIDVQKSLNLPAKFAPTNDESFINLNADCSELESRIYRWLSFSFPIYERWTGQTFLTPPNMKDFIDYPEVFTSSNPKYNKVATHAKSSNNKSGRQCFLNRFKSLLNAKGLVMSIGNQHVDDTIRLIRLLRALNNRYPIQIAYYDNLSQNLKDRIIDAARNDFKDLPESFKSVKHHFPSDYFNKRQGGLPKQEIWFVNTYNTIKDNYRHKFGNYANKYFATIFNSFSEFMVIDADAALLKPTEYFFNMKSYIDKGAYFFKDRSIVDIRPQSDLVFFQKLMPSLLDSALFDIPVVTNKTLDLSFMQGTYHYVESGVVLINRMQHFNALLSMVQLNFYHALTERVHGDKEVFWLAFSAIGDESVQFNKYFAASIGTTTPQLERLKSDGSELESYELCGNHPGHVSGEDDHSLLWLNSGFIFCPKNVNYEHEAARGRIFKTFKPDDASKLEQFYKSKIHITQAILPPYTETKLENIDEEPQSGWFYADYCGAYTWCAYSKIGGKMSNGEDNSMYGKLINYEDWEIDLFNYYGDVWMGN